jgi:hypothetical protein
MYFLCILLYLYTCIPHYLYPLIYTPKIGVIYIGPGILSQLAALTPLPGRAALVIQFVYFFS